VQVGGYETAASTLSFHNHQDLAARRETAGIVNRTILCVTNDLTSIELFASVTLVEL
jgi:hypothetical protein